ncbi:MAG: hypothetical protein WDZ88_00410 [Candidatus Paceibacterota bacterium]
MKSFEKGELHHSHYRVISFIIWFLISFGLYIGNSIYIPDRGLHFLMVALLLVWCVFIPVVYVFHDGTKTKREKKTELGVWCFLLVLLFFLTSATIQFSGTSVPLSNPFAFILGLF